MYSMIRSMRRAVDRRSSTVTPRDDVEMRRRFNDYMDSRASDLSVALDAFALALDRLRSGGVLSDVEADVSAAAELVSVFVEGAPDVPGLENSPTDLDLRFLFAHAAAPLEHAARFRELVDVLVFLSTRILESISSGGETASRGFVDTAWIVASLVGPRDSRLANELVETVHGVTRPRDENHAKSTM